MPMASLYYAYKGGGTDGIAMALGQKFVEEFATGLFPARADDYHVAFNEYGNAADGVVSDVPRAGIAPSRGPGIGAKLWTAANFGLGVIFYPYSLAEGIYGFFSGKDFAGDDMPKWAAVAAAVPLVGKFARSGERFALEAVEAAGATAMKRHILAKEIVGHAYEKHAHEFTELLGRVPTEAEFYGIAREVLAARETLIRTTADTVRYYHEATNILIVHRLGSDTLNGVIRRGESTMYRPAAKKDEFLYK